MCVCLFSFMFQGANEIDVGLSQNGTPGTFQQIYMFFFPSLASALQVCRLKNVLILIKQLDIFFRCAASV